VNLIAPAALSTRNRIAGLRLRPCRLHHHANSNDTFAVLSTYVQCDRNRVLRVGLWSNCEIKERVP
jgi:hypothetical protein